MKKNNKGFTLVEILAVFVLIGILAVIAIVTVNSIRSKQRETYNVTQNALFVETAKLFFEEHKDLLPQTLNSSEYVTLEELLSGGYLTENFTDYDNNLFNGTSKVKVTKVGPNKYVYSGVLLDKEGEVIAETPDNKSTITFPSIKKGNTAISPVSGKYYANQSPKIEFKISDADELKGYTYAVYKGSNKVKTSDIISIDNASSYSDSVSLNISSYNDGEYRVRIYAYDSNGNVVSANSPTIVIDTTAPTCDFTITGTEGSNGWYTSNVTLKLNVSDKNTINMSQGISDSTSETYTNVMTKTQSDTKRKVWYGYVKDVAGNTGKCQKEVKVDTKKPVCTFSNDVDRDVISGNKIQVNMTCEDTTSYVASNTQPLTVDNFSISSTAAKVNSVSNPTIEDNKYSYTITIEGVSYGTFTLNLNVNSIKDTAGNSNAKSTSRSMTSYNRAEIPTNSFCKSKENSTYTGSAITLTKTGNVGFTFSGNNQTNANESGYTITANLTEGYKWSDNTFTAKTFKCPLYKATPVLTPKQLTEKMVVGNTLKVDEKSTAKGKFTVSSSDTSVASISQANSGEVAANTTNLITITAKKVGTVTITIKFTVSDTSNYNSISPQTYTIAVKKAVASVTTNGNTIYYDSLEDAINSGNGGTVKLLTDTNEDITINSGTNTTVDLNGKTVTGNITNNGNTTITNGTINGNVTNNGTITTDDITIKGNYDNEGKGNINNTEIDGKYDNNGTGTESNVTKKDTRKLADMPTNSICVSRTYNGSSQQLTNITGGTGYTLSNYIQTNAGKYNVVASLTNNNEYKWKNESTKDIIIECSMAKATPVITLSNTSGSMYVGRYEYISTGIKSGTSADVVGTVHLTSSNTTYATVQADEVKTVTQSGGLYPFGVTGKSSNGKSPVNVTITISFTPTSAYANNFNSAANKTYTMTINPYTHVAEFNPNNNGVNSLSLPSGCSKDATTGIVKCSCTTSGTNTSCNVNVPTITAPSNTPNVCGFTTSHEAAMSGCMTDTSITLTGNKTYYAQTYSSNTLERKTYTVNWNANGATLSSTAPSTCTSDTRAYNGHSQACTVDAPTITRSEYETVGFNYTSTATTNMIDYNWGTGKVTVYENTNLYAITRYKVEVTFYANNSTLTLNESTASGDGYLKSSCYIYNTNDSCSLWTPRVTGSTNTPNVAYMTFQPSPYNSYDSGVRHNQIVTAYKEGIVYFRSGIKSKTFYAITYSNTSTYTANWNGNGATLSSTDQSSCKTAVVWNGATPPTSCTVDAPTITRDGHTIVGYNTSASSTTNNSKYDTSTKKLTITSSTNGGTWYAITYYTTTMTFSANNNTIRLNGATATGSGTLTNSCNVYNTNTTCTMKTPEITSTAVDGATKLGFYYYQNYSYTDKAADSLVSPSTDFTVTKNGYIYYQTSTTKTLYAQTYVEKTYSVTLSRNTTEVASIQSTQASCSVRGYNGSAVPTSCSTYLYYSMTTNSGYYPFGYHTSINAALNISSDIITVGTTIYITTDTTDLKNKKVKSGTTLFARGRPLLASETGYADTYSEMNIYDKSGKLCTNFQCAIDALAGRRVLVNPAGPAAHYAFGTPTTSSTTDYTSLGKNVFIELKEGQLSVCINRNNELICIKPNDSSASTNLREAWNDNGACSGSPGVYYCYADDFSCYILMDGDVYCNDNINSTRCEVTSSGSASCK